jgi:hypothetical protein
MTDLPLDLRRRLADEFVLTTPTLAHRESRPTAPKSFSCGSPTAPDRIGVHPGHAVDDVLHLDAGRVRDGMRLLLRVQGKWGWSGI